MNDWIRPWISVKDKLPQKEKDILICNDEGKVQFGIYSRNICGDKFYTTNFEEILLPGVVTYWMPLPLPPETNPEKTTCHICSHELQESSGYCDYCAMGPVLLR
ncbi:MAG TPA: DUF551 domain-containing protein [Saprospiraceae bacterium]|nr:DUF551 domain-containing protein [Saprospiraceae bacterium]